MQNLHGTRDRKQFSCSLTNHLLHCVIPKSGFRSSNGGEGREGRRKRGLKGWGGVEGMGIEKEGERGGEKGRGGEEEGRAGVRVE